MKKDNFNSFIKKYYLNGAIESVKWSIKDKQISTNFSTTDKTLVGSITQNNFDIEDCELGIYTTSQLQKILSVFSSDIDVSITAIDNVARVLKLKDSDSQVNYMLADLAVIPISGKPKSLPAFEFKMNITEDFINKFNKAKNALPDISHVTFNCSKDKNEMIIGYSKNNSTRITVNVVGSSSTDINYKAFNSNHLKEILSANEDLTNAVIEISSKGLMKVTYDNKSYNSNYYLPEVNYV